LEGSSLFGEFLVVDEAADAQVGKVRGLAPNGRFCALKPAQIDLMVANTVVPRCRQLLQ
jgi:hypothetical protein